MLDLIPPSRSAKLLDPCRLPGVSTLQAGTYPKLTLSTSSPPAKSNSSQLRRPSLDLHFHVLSRRMLRKRCGYERHS